MLRCTKLAGVSDDSPGVGLRDVHIVIFLFCSLCGRKETNSRSDGRFWQGYLRTSLGSSVYFFDSVQPETKHVLAMK